MTAGVWIAPAALAGPFGILWVATWLEHFIVPSAFDPLLRAPAPVDATFAEVVGRPEVFALARQPDVDLGHVPAGARTEPPRISE
jgi:hypothetical protein